MNALIDNTQIDNAELATIGDNGAPVYSLKKLLADAKKFGDASSKGDAALPSLALEVANAAYEGVLKIDGAGDDIEAIFEAYMKARTKQTEVGSIKQQVSKLRTIANAARYAATDEDGNPYPVAELLANANQRHIDAYNSADLRKTMVKGSRYDFLLKVAREQNKLIPDGTPVTADVELLSEDAIGELLFPGEKEAKTMAERVEKIWNEAKKIRDGKKDKDGNVTEPGLDEPELDEAIAQLTDLMWKLNPEKMEEAAEKEKGKAQAAMLAAQFGFKLVKAKG